MEQTNYSSTRSMPYWLPVVAAGCLLLWFSGWLFEKNNKIESVCLIKWVDLKGAENLAEKTNKPVLYEFSADWCSPCKRMERETFIDRKAAELINRNFVPVHVVDRSREQGVNPAAIRRLQHKYELQSFPTLVVARADGEHFVAEAGYESRAQTIKFLRSAIEWHKKPEESDIIQWSDIRKAKETAKQSGKPLLYLFWNQSGSEYTRTQYLENRKLSRLINKRFTPVLIIYDASTEVSDPPVVAQLKRDYDVKTSPTLVVVPLDGTAPHYNLGYSYSNEIVDFLEKFLTYHTARV